MKKNKITYLIVATTIATQILPVGSIISNAQQVGQKVATVRDGEAMSISNNEIEVRGLLYDTYGTLLRQGFNVKFNADNKTFQVTNKVFSNEQIHPGFGSRIYFKMDLFSSDGDLKDSVSIAGNQCVEDIEKSLNGKKFMYGDYITIYHEEGGDRLKIYGDVINGDSGLSEGISKDTLSKKCFKITRYGLVEVNIHKILQNEINILGIKYQSGRQGFRVRFDMTKGKMIVDRLGVEYAKFNNRFKGKGYINFELIRDGQVVNSLSLNGDDKVEKALLLQKMTLNFGDKIRITHEESGSNIRISGQVGNASQENMQDGLNKKTITLELTEHGLSEVNQ